MEEDGSEGRVGRSCCGAPGRGRGPRGRPVGTPGGPVTPAPAGAPAVLLPLLLPYVLLGGTSIPLGAWGVNVPSKPMPEEVSFVVKVVISWNVFFINCLS